MNTFRIKKYKIHTNKIQNPDGVRCVLMADQHGVSYGRDNCRLLDTIRDLQPEAVLAAGDMAVRTEPDTLVTACKLLTSLAEEFPVYYALGNHEYKMYLDGEFQEYYRKYEKAVRKAGVHILRNTHEEVIICGDHFCFFGLELPIEYYHKPRSPKLYTETIKELIGSPGTNGMQILLAHNPKYGKTYFKWGADMIVSGHYHGGVVRLSEHHGLSSPQYLVLPPFCCGDFHRGDQHMFVSAGMGEHTLPLRIHNPRELLVIDVKPSGKRNEETINGHIR